MKINKIVIKGFRSHLDTEILSLRRFNVFMGLNGSGKSSVIDAIQYGLTGTCRGTDAAGRGNEDLAINGAGGYEISLYTSLGLLTRCQGQGPRSQSHARIAKITGMAQEMARVLAQPGQFMQLNMADQKALLTSVMAQKLTAADVMGILGGLIDMPGGSRLACESLTTLEGVNEIERQLREKRPTLKSELTACVDAPANELPGIEATPEILAECKEDLLELERELVEAMAAAAGAGHERAALQARLDDLTKKGEQLSARIDALGDRKGIGEALADARGKVAAVEQSEQKRSEQVRQIEGELSEARATMNVIKEQGARLSTLKGTCPTCDQAVPPEYAKEALASLRAKYERVAKGIKEHQGQLNALQQVGLGVTPAALRENIEALGRALSDWDQLRERYDEITAEYTKVEVLLKAPAAPAPAAAQIKALEDRVAAGRVYVKHVENILAARKRAGEIQAKREHLQRQLQWVEQVIETLGPKGPIRAKLIGGGLAELQDELNAIAGGLAMPKVVIVIEPWLITVGGLPSIMLSESEQYRLSLAFAGVFAKRSGAGILCLDGADILDEGNRGLLPVVLESCGLEQAIIAVTAAPPYPACDGQWAYYSIGKIDGHSCVSLNAAPQAVAA